VAPLELQQADVRQHECFAAPIPAVACDSQCFIEGLACSVEISRVEGENAEIVERHQQRPLVAGFPCVVGALLDKALKLLFVAFVQAGQCEDAKSARNGASVPELVGPLHRLNRQFAARWSSP